MKKNHLILAALLLSASASHAALIAHYDFSDGKLLDDETGIYDLTQSTPKGDGITLNGDGFSANFDSSAGANYLIQDNFNTAAGAAYTVSMWFRSSNMAQAGQTGMFSTIGASQWQLEIGTTSKIGVRLSTNPGELNSGILPANDTWTHYAFVTDGAGTSQLYVTKDGETLTLTDTDAATFGLEDFRIGVNRGGNLTYDGDYANIAIYDTALDTAALQTVLNAGPAAVPEPSSAALLGLGGLALILRRRK